MSYRPLRSLLLVVAITAAVTGAFLFDISIEAGVAAGVTYLLAIFIAYLTHDKRTIWVTATVSTLLIPVGLLLSPPGGELWKTVANRILSLVVIWSTTILCQRILGLMSKLTRRLEELNAAVEVSEKHRSDQQRRARAMASMMEDLGRERNKLQSEVAVRKTTEQALNRSNHDLEQFAYVASHDLQEPLRKIASFCQLLQQENQHNFDEQSLLYIAYVVDGAKRMRQLLNDLLAYSRVTSRPRQLITVDSELACTAAIANLAVSIGESKANVTYDSLPRVCGDTTQLTQLFQNLIANAIKYRGEQAPRIHVAAKDKDSHWEFSVSDNGIGIDPEYHDRIFAIFQRLHNREEYEGTGIGLSLCKKVVARFGGRIWVKSSVGQGSTFYFTLPKKGVVTDDCNSSDPTLSAACGSPAG